MHGALERGERAGGATEPARLASLREHRPNLLRPTTRIGILRGILLASVISRNLRSASFVSVDASRLHRQ